MEKYFSFSLEDTTISNNSIEGGGGRGGGCGIVNMSSICEVGVLFYSFFFFTRTIIGNKLIIKDRLIWRHVMLKLVILKLIILKLNKLN